nr:hypothetical protein [Tanacetum cinerariifolium]
MLCHVYNSTKSKPLIITPEAIATAGHLLHIAVLDVIHHIDMEKDDYWDDVYDQDLKIEKNSYSLKLGVGGCSIAEERHDLEGRRKETVGVLLQLFCLEFTKFIGSLDSRAMSGRIYVVDILKDPRAPTFYKADPRAPTFYKAVEPSDISGLSFFNCTL